MVKIIDTANYKPRGADETQWVYNALDCAVTAEVYEALLPQLDDTTRATYELSKRLQGPILEMNLTGLQVDFFQVRKRRREMQADVARLQEQANAIMNEGYNFPDLNWRSSLQLKIFFYDHLALPEKRKRNTAGKFVPSVDRDALEALRVHLVARPAIDHILTLRDLDKRLSFLDTNIDDDGRLRTAFNICGTNTGRLASAHSYTGSGRNLQNVDRQNRRVVIASKGKRLCNIDLEQADSRAVGATCWNKFVATHGEAYAGAYLDACESGDLHTTVTMLIWPELEWPDDPAGQKALAETIFYREKTYRDVSKTGGHGSNYMLTPRSMATKAHVAVKVAEAFQEKYFGTFPAIAENHKAVREEIKRSQTLTSIWGRRRQFHGRPNDDRTIRQAVAYEGQAGTADAINYGLCRLYYSDQQWPGFRLLCQVHDSILFEYDEECEDEIIPWAIERLEVPLTLERGRPFYIPAEAKVGWNWGDYHVHNNPDGMLKWKGKPDRRNRVHRVSYRK